jgi:transcriptional regulator GlxA family with amidase domain
MQIAILTFDGFNEIDSFVACNILNRVKGWKASIVAPVARVVSRSGVTVEAQQLLEFAGEADAVIVGSGSKTDAISKDRSILDRIRIDPNRQLVASQCSGALILNALGLLSTRRVCTDHMTKPLFDGTGIEILEQAFHAECNLASAGGCLASQYIAAWMMIRSADEKTARETLYQVAPIGEKDLYIDRAIAAVRPFVGDASRAA